MIPRAYITEWRRVAPWQLNEQVEQDLVLSRVLVEIFKNEFLAERLTFRGGTALHKLHLAPAPRYSEDIDLVQARPEPIGETVNHLRKVLSPWLGEPSRRQANRNTTLIFRCASEIPPSVSLRIKIEINCREHFTVDGIRAVHFRVDSGWFANECELRTHSLEELLATKMRALYQRRKGRDLFDLWYALSQCPVDARKAASMFVAYMANGGTQVTRREYEENMEQKIDHPDFLRDTESLLRPDVAYAPYPAWEMVRDTLIKRLE